MRAPYVSVPPGYLAGEDRDCRGANRTKSTEQAESHAGARISAAISLASPGGPPGERPAAYRNTRKHSKERSS